MKTLASMSGIAIVWMSVATVTADPILLASYETTGGIEISVASEPLVRLALELSTSSPPYESFRLGMGVMWEDNDAGVIDFAASTDDAFEGFAGLALNGIDDEFAVLVLFQDQGGGSGGPESQLFGGSPDLVGNELEFVRLIVHDLQIEPSAQFPLGFKVDYDLTYEFFGSLVPEPHTVALLTAGASLVFRQCGVRRAQGKRRT